ncbi:MATE family efflux transporter [Tritonibacter mobilis]|uniref:MATE family efflux transporter n=1 Tax=Tritonibacter mobilis TaxID=379347 RepID=UPI001C0A1788|nr:MATE family efflux transporter [Tritonibacter mobilis]MBU3036368.1 MATE family efflux transporter [Tritonibacter mobilis]WHQ83119.1 MATE family efflux transporter [Tritonibacter mobilis]
MTSSPTNHFLTGRLGPTYAKTALPIIFVMGMNGCLTVADALFLGHFVGPEALAAVTLMFPAYMLVVALATLVASGMSSRLARHLGAGDVPAAQEDYAGAHGLALAVAVALMVAFVLWGDAVTQAAAGGDATLAAMGHTYLRITVGCTPLLFVLSVNSDALRNEGRAGLMALMSLVVSLSNIAFNYLLIAKVELGVAGSALGTALAQALALALILGFRLRGNTVLRPAVLWQQSLIAGWGRMLALGAPQSLNFIGIALGSAAIMAALQWVEAPDYAKTLTAYGVITRLLTFTFLPLLGLSHAMQSITGNLYGAGERLRARQSLRLAIWIALIYCAVTQATLSFGAAQIASWFVADPGVIAQVARILPILGGLFVLAGPLMMVAMHFQAIGDAARAALLGLAKPYLFSIPLTFVLAAYFGETGIWLAAPLAEAALLLLTLSVLIDLRRRHGRRRYAAPTRASEGNS